MPKKTEIDHYSDKEALDFHIKGKSGKIEIGSSKPLTTKNLRHRQQIFFLFFYLQFFQTCN